MATNLIKLEELNETDIFMAKRYFNSKRTTWQPCRIISTIPTINGSGHPVIYVRFLDGVTKHIFVRNTECGDNFGDQVLKKVPKNYFENEIKKLKDQQEELQRQVDLLTQAKNN
jgi:hypothetical protein